MEAKYKLTRNDPTFSFDLSEQNLVCGVPGGITGPQYGLQHSAAMGVCTDAELPYTQQSPPAMAVASGWQNRVVEVTAYQHYLPSDTRQPQGRVEGVRPARGQYSRFLGLRHHRRVAHVRE